MKLIYTCTNPTFKLLGTDGSTILDIHSEGNYRFDFDLNALIGDGAAVATLFDTFKRTVKEMHHASTMMYQQHRYAEDAFSEKLRAARDQADAAAEGTRAATREHAFNQQMEALSKSDAKPFAPLDDILPH